MACGFTSVAAIATAAESSARAAAERPFATTPAMTITPKNATHAALVSGEESNGVINAWRMPPFWPQNPNGLDPYPAGSV